MLRPQRTDSPHPSSDPPSFIQSWTQPSHPEDLTRLFNTVLVASKGGTPHHFLSELKTLTESRAFKAILTAVQELACSEKIRTHQAAEQIIQTFRKIDDIWQDYLLKEGLEKLRKPRKFRKSQE